jgi:hypothetical protein
MLYERMDSAQAAPSTARVTVLATPPPACLVPPGVFDAFAWCASDTLEWRRPASRWDATPCVDGSDPARMVFVFRSPCDFLPQELARLHAPGLGLGDELALAPWGIDDATDHLYGRTARPRDLLWLAADNLNALFWGLHDWAHFHNHGPFERRAWTELQCDASALAWLRLNRTAIGVSPEVLGALAEGVAQVAHARFAAEPDARVEPAPATRPDVDAVLTAAWQSLCSEA